jgi:plastocyanin domain-containing protein
MKNGFIVILIIILIAAAGFFLMKDSKTYTGNSVETNSDSENIQKVTLSIKNGNYYPNTVRVKANQPVRIYLDKSVSGCYRSFTIRDFGIAKYLPTEKDYVEFTPSKKGTFRFACSMGMGTGTLIVE